MQELFHIMAQIGNKRTYQNGEILFLQGAMPTHLYLLLSGKVRLYKTKEHISSTQLTLHTAHIKMARFYSCKVLCLRIYTCFLVAKCDFIRQKSISQAHS